MAVILRHYFIQLCLFSGGTYVCHRIFPRSYFMRALSAFQTQTSFYAHWHQISPKHVLS